MEWGEYIEPTVDTDGSAIREYAAIVDPMDDDHVTYPFTFLMDTNGTIRYFHSVSSPADLAAAIEELL